MNKKIRDALFIIFIIIFILLSTFTCLYAAGYKFNLTWPIKLNRVLQKTGMINITTSPKQAYIFLDDKPQKKSAFSFFRKDYLTTPTKIKNVLPGEYLLRLEKENYWPLEKRVSVISGQTTFLEEINLFRSELPLLILNYPETEIFLNNNRRFLYLNNNHLIINTSSDQEPDYFTNITETAIWMKTGNKLFANGKIKDLDKKNSLDLRENFGQNIKKWYYNEQEDRIFYHHGDTISRLESDYRTSTVVIQGENYLDFQIRQDNFFAIIKEQDKIYLRNYNLKNNTLTGELNLPQLGNYEFKSSNNKYLSIYDDINNTLYLINLSDWKNSAAIQNVKSWSWMNDEQIIFNNNWEVNTFNLISGATSLITRWSEEIKKTIWHNNSRYFIFTTASSINVGDVNNKNVLNILTANKVLSPTLDEKNDFLYFYGEFADETGIYKITLQ